MKGKKNICIYSNSFSLFFTFNSSKSCKRNAHHQQKNDMDTICNLQYESCGRQIEMKQGYWILDEVFVEVYKYEVQQWQRDGCISRWRQEKGGPIVTNIRFSERLILLLLILLLLIFLFQRSNNSCTMILEFWKTTWNEKVLGPQQVKTQLKASLDKRHT